MGLLQTIVSVILHAGHASKRVYTRLNKLGICVSHESSNKIFRKLGENYDQKVRDWMAACKFTISSQKDVMSLPDGDQEKQQQQPGEEQEKQQKAVPSQCYAVIFQGDNIDKNLHVRDMRVDNQNTSLHYFNSYAVKDRVPCSAGHDTAKNGVSCYEIDGANIPKDLRSTPCTLFLPNLIDCKSLRDNYVHFVATVLVENFTFLQPFKACVPQHLKHKYSVHMAKRSEIVSLGVIPKNENKREEMTEIVETLQEYVPGNGDQLLKVPFGGDQLTAERTRNVQLSRVNSGNKKDALQGFVPFSSDWHAELTLLQIMFDRLYRCGSNCDGGTLLQLRNLINRRNVAKDVNGRFNECIDFFEMVVKSHIIAAGMHFFGLKDLSGNPTVNVIASDVHASTLKKRWGVLFHVIGHLVDSYVIVQKHARIQPEVPVQEPVTVESIQRNPHAVRIQSEHNYSRSNSLPTQVDIEHCYAHDVPHPNKQRHLPIRLCDVPAADAAMQEKLPDGVLNYASAVLNDGLLMLEFRDGIREGDGERILRCWKFMLLYFRHFNHYKYALEAFHTLALVNLVAPPHVQQQIIWSRVVNSRGGAGNNIPVDLHMEHLNRLLKNMIIGIGANISEQAIIQASKSLDGMKSICENFDKSAGIHADSVHHATKSSKKDQGLVVQQLVDSNVFAYIPGRKHTAFPEIKPNLAQSIDTKSLFKWLDTNKVKLAKKIELENLLLRK